MSIGDIVKYGKWLAGHAGQLTQIVALVEELKAAATFIAKIDVAIKFLNLVKELMADFPGDDDVVTTQADLTVVQQQVTAAGLDWGQIIAILPILIPFLKAMYDLFNKPVST